MIMARILIAGCGDVGTALGVRLAAEGHLVWGLRRHGEMLPAAIQPLTADVTKPETLTVVPPALDFVFYTAAPDHSTDDAYQAIYVDGLRYLLAALNKQSPTLQRFFFTSSTGVYGQTCGEWVDETSPTEPNHFSGKLLLTAEQVVLHGRFPATVIRLGGIYGPGRTRLIDTVRRGTAICSDGPPQYTNRIHRDDCAGVLQHLLRLPEPDRLYLGVDHEPADTCTVMHWLALQLGAPLPHKESGSGFSTQPSRSNKRCSNRKLVATGYEFRYPTFREGYAVLLVNIEQTN